MRFDPRAFLASHGQDAAPRANHANHANSPDPFSTNSTFSTPLADQAEFSPPALSAPMPEDKTDKTDETHAEVVKGPQNAQPETVMSVKSVSSVGGKGENTPPAEVLPFAPPSAPAPSRDDDPFQNGASVTGLPRTWTGRVVSLDEWRTLTNWQKHGPAGRMYCGACQSWIMPGDCPHTEGGAV